MLSLFCVLAQKATFLSIDLYFAVQTTEKTSCARIKVILKCHRWHCLVFMVLILKKKKKELLKIKTNCSYTQCISGNVERVILYKIAFPTAKKCVLDCQ